MSCIPEWAIYILFLVVIFGLITAVDIIRRYTSEDDENENTKH